MTSHCKAFINPVKAICLLSILNLFVFNYPRPVKAQTLKLGESQASNQQENLIKCGYRQKQKDISWQLPAKIPGGKYPVFRVDRGTRCDEYIPPIRLTALIPESPISTTIDSHPTLFFYIPDTYLEEAEFVLLDESHQIVYQKTWQIKETDRIVSVDFSDLPSLPPLEIGKRYSWHFLINFDRSTPEDAVAVSGWIERIELNTDIKRQLEMASPQAQPAIYAANGIWYNALASLAELRCASPDNSTLTSDWESLLRQVGLQEISSKPVVSCP